MRFETKSKFRDSINSIHFEQVSSSFSNDEAMYVEFNQHMLRHNNLPIPMKFDKELHISNKQKSTDYELARRLVDSVHMKFLDKYYYLMCLGKGQMLGQM